MNVIHRSLRSMLLTVAVVMAALLLAACDDDGDSVETDLTPTTAASPTAAFDPLTPEEVTAPGPYDVGVTTFELVDTSRPTAPSGDAPGSDRRVLTTEVWYPAVADPAKPDGRDLPVDETAGPYPLIVFAHGLSSSRNFSPDYTTHLASHGYIVAAPDFPLTRIGTPGGVQFDDTVNQAGDVSFVIDSLLRFNETNRHLLQSAIDRETIGLTGHSGGGFTTLITVYGLYGAERDERIDAALPISASGCFYGEEEVGDVNIPMMFVTGSEDLVVPRAGNRIAYDNANAPRYWVEIVGATHVRFTIADIPDEAVVDGVLRLTGRDPDQAEPPPTGESGDPPDGCLADPDPLGAEKLTLEEQHEALQLYATPFFDAYLRDDPAALQFLHEALPDLKVANYEYDIE